MRRFATRHEPVNAGGGFLLGMIAYVLTGVASILGIAGALLVTVADQLPSVLRWIAVSVPAVTIGPVVGAICAVLLPRLRFTLAYTGGLVVLPLVLSPALILSGASTEFWVPVPCVLVGLAGARLWNGAPAYDPRLCTCGYNLRGSISGICPECGVRSRG